MQNTSAVNPSSRSMSYPASTEPTSSPSVKGLKSHSIANLNAKVQVPENVKEFCTKTEHVKQQTIGNLSKAQEKQPALDSTKLSDRIRAPILFLLNALFKLGVFDYKLQQKAGHLIGDDILEEPSLQNLNGGLYFSTAKMLVDDMKKFIDPQGEGHVLEMAEQYLQSCKENIPILLNNLVNLSFGFLCSHQ